jgi:hypothetical protein
MTTKVNVICDKCGKEFQRCRAEFNRSIRLERKQFCSRHCCGISNSMNLPRDINYGLPYLKSNNRLDEYSPFRILHKTARRHAEDRNRDFTITLQDLKNVWDKQGGKCPYTGWELFHLPTRANEGLRSDRASLDRRDSSKGYTPDNIQIVSYMANCAKNIFSEESLIDFCKAVAKNHLT